VFFSNIDYLQFIKKAVPMVPMILEKNKKVDAVEEANFLFSSEPSEPLYRCFSLTISLALRQPRW
jgi:hypothetical protein